MKLTNKKRFFTLLICLVLFAGAVSGGVLFAKTFLYGIPLIDVDGDDIPVEPLHGGRVNVLVLGTDKSGYLSDTIMLFSLDVKNKTVSVLSIYRDTRVRHGNNYVKINSLISTKEKEQATKEAVKKITGLPVNFYVTVSVQAFRNIIDILGGVEFDVPNINNGGMYYDDPHQDLHIALKAGVQILDGEKAEGFVRYRSGYPEADIARVRAQQAFLKALVQQKLNIGNIDKVPQIVNQIQEHVRTNLTGADILSIAATIKDVKPEDIQTFALPSEPVDIGGESYVQVHENEMKKLAEEHFSLSE